MQAVAFASPDRRMGPPTGISAGPRKDIKPELLLEGIDVWLQEPLVRRQISPSLAEIIKTALGETYMRLALLPTPMKPSATASPKELVWCCVAFMAYNVRGRAGNERKRLQIDKLLEHCKYPLTMFFKEQRTIASVVMPFFAKQEGLSLEALEQRTQLRELQMSFVYSAAIMRRYKELFSNKFDVSTPSHPASDPNYRLGWLVFLAAKAKLLPPNPDLIVCFNLLVAVFNVLVAHMPKRRLHLGASGPQAMTATADDGRIDTVASLAAMHHADPAQVATLVAKLDHLLQDILKDKGLEQGPHPDEAKVSVSCQHWPCLLEDADVRKRAITALEDAYLAANEVSGAQYDEQVHLEPDISVGGIPMSPLRVMPRVSQYSNAQSSSHLHSAAVSTPVRNGVIATIASPAPTPRVAGAGAAPSTPRTPRGSSDGVSFSDAISCTSWLRDIAGSAEAAPTEGLLRFFRTCGGSDKTEEVKSRARLVEQVFPGSPERQQDALKVYYRVLENVLEAEERRSSSQGVEGLLSSNSFHSCMLACASEVVVACYKIITLPFPEVPERLGLKAFDIFKIIQCFVRHEPSLPRGVKRHLVGIEEQVVESLAMAPGSSMFPSLVFAQQALRLGGPRPPRAPQQRARQVKRAMSFTDEGGSSDAVPTPPESSGLQGLAKIKTSRMGALQHGKPPVSPRVSGLQPQPSTPMKAATATGFHLIPSPAPKKLRVDEGGSSVPSGAEVKQEPLLQLQGLQLQGFSRSQLPQSVGEDIEAPSFMDGPIVLLVRDFFKKACILSWVRLAQLCEHMEFGAHGHGDILAKVYGVVRFGLFERTSLLYGRHLDQLLLCALYGVCKVLRLEGMTFKELTTHYKRQTGINTGASLRQEVFRNVVIEFEGDSLQPKECGDIISFYNKVFIPAMKPALMNLGPSAQGTGDAQRDQQHPHQQPQSQSGIKTVPASPLSRRMIPGSPLRKASGPGGPFAELPGMGGAGIPLSPIKTKVAANYNVFVSPMRDPVMTPRTNQLFCVGDQSPMVLAKSLADFGEASVAGAMEWQPASDGSTDQGRSENSSEQSTGGESSMQQ